MKVPYPIQLLGSLLLYTIMLNNDLSAQCKDGESSKSISYDTVLSGGGNDAYSFSFPQFDPTLGTLVKVAIESEITVKYNYQLENTDANNILYRVRVNRTDDINCSALIAPLSKTQTKTLNSHFLDRFDGILNFGPDYVSVGPVYAFNKSQINYNITDQVAGFLGIGMVNFDYASTTDSYPSGSSHYLYSTNATDSISVRLTYYYCAVNFLSSDIRNFSATKQDAGIIQLNWYSPNDATGEKYEIQKSSDGRSFLSVQTIVSGSNAANRYAASYQLRDDDGMRLFFRIKHYELGGNITYTPVRIVTLSTKQAPVMKVYPTIVTDYVRVYFANMPKDDWRIRIVNLHGILMKQIVLSGANFVGIPVSGSLPAGFYIVQAENKRTHELQVAKINVQ